MDLIAELVSFLGFGLVAIASITAVMNPASTIAVYTALTEGMGGSERMKVIQTSMKIAFIVL
ncbi:MAG TPA: MarC family protein, partial [Methanoculleus sp.]|nr:MarC family protein [Methanoculleus sp.]